MFAALQRGVPQQFGAVLVLEPVEGFDAAAVTTTLADRVCAVPRLRQRLVKVPPGCGRPIWVDDASFSVHRHVEYLTCPSPGDESALLDVAAKLIMRRLPMDHPLWHASVVTGLAGGRVALILVVQHALADGIGGLAVLGALVDGAPIVRPPFPIPPPRLGTLAVDALLSRIREVRQWPTRFPDTVDHLLKARGPRIGLLAAGGGGS
jgi:hypothetical protein